MISKFDMPSHEKVAMQGNADHVMFQPEVKTVVFVLTACHLGSLNEVRLVGILNSLLCTASTDSHLLVLDLRNVRSYGAGFLGLLARVHSILRTRGKHLLICGDHAAVVSRVQLNKLIPVFTTLDEASEYCRKYADTTVFPASPQDTVSLRFEGAISRNSNVCPTPHSSFGSDQRTTPQSGSTELH